MTTKTLWTICFVLLIALFYVVGENLNISKYPPSRTVSGVKTELPKMTENLQRPPVKNPVAIEPNINAKAAILIDEKTFKILYEKNSEQKVPIASTTKIMTGLVVLENYLDNINDVVTITSGMVNVEGSDIQLRVGEKMTIENLLKGLLIMSGNDAAFSLASYLGGKENFVKIMNDKANFLGLKNTSYNDPAGLDDEGHSTAKDLAIIGAYAMRNQAFSDIVKNPNTTITSTDGFLVHELKNSNRMLRQEEQFYYPFAIGIKTGFTNEAGHCLVGAAEKDGHRLIAVILNTNENTLTASAKESRKLLDWGFANWNW